MKMRWMLLPGILLALANGSLALADSFSEAQEEIDYLLDFVEVSGCDFYRNGSWHDSTTARSHLAKKRNYLAKRNRINTAEDFIDKAASKSSLSGKIYEVRCGDCATVTSREWLTAVLVRYRVVSAREP